MRRYYGFLVVCVVILVFCMNRISAADCDYNWSAMGSPNGAVYAIARSGNVLYVGGNFTSIGGIQANHIAKWDGQGWAIVGPAGSNNGVGGVVRVIVIDGNDVYVGGQFFRAGNIFDVGHVAKWDGSNWSKLGDGVTGIYGLEAITIAGDGVYVGGWFTHAGGVQANNVARWSNGAWYKLEADFNGQLLNGVPGIVYALGVQYGSDVYIGGDFILPGQGEQQYPHGLMIWYSSSGDWNPYVLGPYGTVYDVTNKSDEMYLRGTFSGGIKSTYNGSSYNSPPGGGVNNTVHTIYFDNVMNHIYAGGAFTAAGGNSANRIARWNGNSWYPLCSGANNTVYAVVAISSSIPAIHWGSVYVGGVFTTAGGKSISNLAHWDNNTILQKTPVDNENLPSEYVLHANFPNPFNPTTIIKFDLPKESLVRLSIYDISGQFITRIVNKMMPAGQHSVEFDASNLSSGIYLYRFEAGGFIQTRKMMLLK